MKYIKEFKLFEAKQVGTIYHYTDIDSLREIIKTNQLTGAGQVSFTRDSRFLDTTVVDGLSNNAECRLVIDGDKLSNNYKIKPVNFYYPSYNSARPVIITGMGDGIPTGTESEEAVETDVIENIKNYIIRIDFIFGEKNRWFVSEPDKNILKFLTSNNIEYKLIK